MSFFAVTKLQDMVKKSVLRKLIEVKLKRKKKKRIFLNPPKKSNNIFETCFCFGKQCSTFWVLHHEWIETGSQASSLVAAHKSSIWSHWLQDTRTQQLITHNSSQPICDVSSDMRRAVYFNYIPIISLKKTTTTMRGEKILNPTMHQNDMKIHLARFSIWKCAVRHTRHGAVAGRHFAV